MSKHKVLFTEGDWSIYDIDPKRETCMLLTSIIRAQHIDCPMTAKSSEMAYKELSWYVTDERYDEYGYHACYGCRERVPDSIVTLMMIHVCVK